MSFSNSLASAKFVLEQLCCDAFGYVKDSGCCVAALTSRSCLKVKSVCVCVLRKAWPMLILFQLVLLSDFFLGC